MFKDNLTSEMASESTKALSFGLLQLHGHDYGLVCEVALSLCARTLNLMLFQ